ncbi:MAG: class I SAM-dependent methyltransferase [Chloroflexota bacterium]|nr:class I SAM-dependent methyltransferase [Chloroflexota bacterium]
MSEADFEALHNQSRIAWDTNAAFWDQQMGEGNEFHRKLVEPALMALLEIEKGQHVLEAACGNGQFARHMAELGATVTAFDFSAPMIDIAKARTRADLSIDYRVIDAVDSRALLGLGEGCFDAAVCSMAFMDMSDIAPLVGALPELLKPGGRFVFSVMHPCFNSPEIMMVMERHERGGGANVERSIKVSRYSQPYAAKGIAMLGQPEPHWYFHRPLSALLDACFRVGFVMDGILEPTFDNVYEDYKTLSWSRLPEIPPVLAARMRLPA